MTRRNLILIHRNHAGRDFREIGQKVHALDQSIAIFGIPGNLATTLPDSEWRYPTLTVAMGADFRMPIPFWFRNISTPAHRPAPSVSARSSAKRSSAM